MSLRPLWKLVLALVCALALVIGPISSAFADDGGTVTKEQLAQLKKASPEDREKVRKIAVDKYTDKICASVITEVIALPGQKALDICRDDVGKQVNAVLDTPEKAVQDTPTFTAICGGLTGPNMRNPGLKKACAIKTVEDLVVKAAKPVLAAVLSDPTVMKVLSVNVKALEVAKFFANPGDAFEQLANHAHDEAVKWTTRVMGEVTASTDFSASEDWFVNSWAAGAGVGLLLLGVMFLLMIKDLGSGELDEDEFRNSLLRWGPGAMVVAVFGPAVMSKLSGVMSTMNQGIIAARGDDLTEKILGFLQGIATMSAASSDLGALLGILVFLLMLIAALMLYLVFLVQHFALILMAYGIAIMLGCLINPKWRPGVLKAASTWVMVLFSKPLLLIMMALIFTVPFGSVGGGSGALATFAQLVLVTLAMGAVAFSPLLLLKYVPMVSSPGGSPWVSGAPDTDKPGRGDSSDGENSETSHMSETADKANQRSRSDSSNTEDSDSGGPSSSSGSPSGGRSPGTGGDEGSSGAPAGSEGSTNAKNSSTKGGTEPTSSNAKGDSELANAGKKQSSGDSGSKSAGSGPKQGGNGGGAGSGGPGASSAPSSSGASAGAGSGAGAASGGAAAKGAGKAAGGAASGVLVAAAAAKKVGDTGRDVLVGLNEDAANFQDYNG
ncbi:hypothetical protein [Kocuria rhizophila]|uniref:hypothetical protein n=1 Tax=Kocuria rhizophila TaxID=72000 RepID=UPI0022F0688E|nr:hypothetical protein [Kocuria rhizophila]MDA4829709.1 hypothetical protein [Kocuria rhizophila]